MAVSIFEAGKINEKFLLLYCPNRRGGAPALDKGVQRKGVLEAK
jgi:hypothetical protein